MYVCANKTSPKLWQNILFWQSERKDKQKTCMNDILNTPNRAMDYIFSEDICKYIL